MRDWQCKSCGKYVGNGLMKWVRHKCKHNPFVFGANTVSRSRSFSMLVGVNTYEALNKIFSNEVNLQYGEARSGSEP